jgi:hypothetical protein
MNSHVSSSGPCVFRSKTVNQKLEKKILTFMDPNTQQPQQKTNEMSMSATQKAFQHNVKIEKKIHKE